MDDNEEESNKSLENIWLSHRRKLGSPPSVVSEAYTVDAVVVYVGTGSVYRGHLAIEQLYKDIRDSWMYIQSSHLVWRTIDEHARTVVAESTLSIQHNRPVPWLLPNVPDTGELLHVNMVTVATFNAAGKCTGERVYWDHASLLNQCRFLGKNVRLRSVEGHMIEVSIPQAKVSDTIQAVWDAVNVAKKHLDQSSIEVIPSTEVKSDEYTDDHTSTPVTSSTESSTTSTTAPAAEPTIYGKRGRSFAGGESKITFG